MKKSLIVLALGVLLLTGVAPIARATTIADLQAQVQSLLNLVASLQSQLAAQTSATYSTYTPAYSYTPTYSYGTTSARPWWCDSYGDVSYGQTSTRVWQLQQAMGYSILGSTPTGYYGPLTYNAWQRYCGASYSYTYPYTGGDRDVHGCIGSAGYSWCAPLNQCIRTWETTCPSTYTTNPANDPNCKSWYDGCNTCSRSYYGGTGMCTMMACFTQGTPYCREYFSGSSTTTNRPPVISSFSGPTTLAVNQQGTWSIQASDPENGQLTYSVTWGDEYTYAYAQASSYYASSFTQSTTFTHTYATAGTYTVTVTVRDSSGQSAQSTSTVRVGSNTVCTQEYSPVCGQMGYPYYTQQTYSNTCYMNAAGATLVHYGVCY